MAKTVNSLAQPREFVQALWLIFLHVLCHVTFGCGCLAAGEFCHLELTEFAVRLAHTRLIMIYDKLPEIWQAWLAAR